MKRLFTWLLAGVLSLSLLQPRPVNAAENPVPKAKQSVVFIAAGIYFENGKLQTYNPEGIYGRGTGFGIGEADSNARTFITNKHVVSNSAGDIYSFVYILIDGADLYNEKTLVKCDVIYVHPEVDLAIIQAASPVSGVSTIPLLPAETMQTGDTVYALGYPAIADDLVDDNNYTVEDITVTNGVISRYVTQDGIRFMAQTAQINGGNSGGPLINENGEVLGINTWALKSNIIYEENGQMIINEQYDSDKRYYALYIDYAMESLDELGISYTDASKEPADPVITIDTIILVLAIAGGVAVIVLFVFKKPQKQKSKNNTPSVTYLVRGAAGSVLGNVWPLKQKLTVGRNPICDIVLPVDTKAVSRNHCCIELFNGVPMLTDFGSTYGTFVNGNKLEPNKPVRLSENAEIQVGSPKTILLLQCTREG